jgi:uncharacterized protein YeaO (DUF488 family)
MIKVKRAYVEAAADDGTRYLVDRLWPRGVTKSSLKIEGSVKDVGPSDALRRWFNHDPKRWDGFRERYFAELDGKPDAWKPLVEAARSSSIMLVYGARDEEHNNAVALAEYLTARMKRARQATKHDGRSRKHTD